MLDSTRTSRLTIASIAVILLLGPGAAGSVWAQLSDGERVFEQSCVSCHNGAIDSRAPGLDALRARTPQAVIESLMTGAMRPQGSRLSGPERRAVAEFVTGKKVGGDVTGADIGRCTSQPRANTANRAVAWSGWSPTITNTRFQSREMAGLTPADVPKLTLKWSLGFPDASVAWSSPTVSGGRVYVGSQNGTVYSLDAKTGCIHWTYSATGGVRTAIAIGSDSAGSARIYFGDTAANAYALDADTGRVVWTRKVDDHPLACITRDRCQLGCTLQHDRAEQRLGIGQPDAGVPFCEPFDRHVAREQQTDGRVGRDRAEREGRIARAKNRERAKLSA